MRNSAEISAIQHHIIKGIHSNVQIVKTISSWSHQVKVVKIALKTVKSASIIHLARQSALHALNNSHLNDRLALRYATQQHIMIGLKIHA